MSFPHLFVGLLALSAVASEIQASDCHLLEMGAEGQPMSWINQCAATPVALTQRAPSLDLKINREAVGGWHTTGTVSSANLGSLEVTHTTNSNVADGVTVSVTVANGSPEPADLSVEVPASLGWQSPHAGDGLAAYLYGVEQVYGPRNAPSTQLGYSVYVRHAVIESHVTANTGALELVVDPEGEHPAALRIDAVLDPGASLSITAALSSVPAISGTDTLVAPASMMYSALWSPIRWICFKIEALLRVLANAIGNLGVAICLLAILVRVVTFPLNRWSARRQREFAATQAEMAPLIADAKRTLKGAEQSQKILDTYKQFNVSPMSGLKGSVALMVQLPVLIAVFNVTSESALFYGAGFLWVDDLSLPDRLITIGYALPVLGAGVNLLPLFLGGLGWYAARSMDSATPSGLWLHALITVLFYSFAAAIVLYWLSINLIQVFESRVLPAAERQR